MPKEELLNTLENRVESHLQQAIGQFQNMQEAQLLRAAKDGGWSIAQCLEHLNSYGHYYLPQIKKGLEKGGGNPPADTFNSSWLGSYFTRAMDPETGRKKIRAFKNHIPAAQLDAHAVVAEFIQQQESLLQYLQQSRSRNLNKIKIPISISRWIRLNLGDVFQFLIAHNERHMQQAERVLKGLDQAPKAHTI